MLIPSAAAASRSSARKPHVYPVQSELIPRVQMGQKDMKVPLKPSESMSVIYTVPNTSFMFLPEKKKI